MFTQNEKILKVLSYWNLNGCISRAINRSLELKVLSYWNLNVIVPEISPIASALKVLSYWNLNYLAEAFYSRAST